jgi:hypothetical protein
VFAGVSLLYTQVIAEGGEHRVAWRMVPGKLGAIEWPRSLATPFRRERNLRRFLARTVPREQARVPSIDYKHRTALLAVAGPRSSSGYRIRIDEIVERRDRVIVRLREVTPRLDDRVSPGVTSPYVFVTIPRSEKKVFFDYAGRP